VPFWSVRAIRGARSQERRAAAKGWTWLSEP
jgi:hypothetical protein